MCKSHTPCWDFLFWPQHYLYVSNAQQLPWLLAFLFYDCPFYLPLIANTPMLWSLQFEWKIERKYCREDKTHWSCEREKMEHAKSIDQITHAYCEMNLFRLLYTKMTTTSDENVFNEIKMLLSVCYLWKLVLHQYHYNRIAQSNCENKIYYLSCTNF